MSDLTSPAIDLFEAIRTARAQRRLGTAPVPEALITRVLDAAIRAPSAGNAQNWHFIVVRDAELRRRVGTLYRKASDIAEAVYQARSHPTHQTEAQWQRMLTAGAHLSEPYGRCTGAARPVPTPARPACARRAGPRLARSLRRRAAYLDRIRGASIYPAVQNIILACRALRPRHRHHHQSPAHRGGVQGAPRHTQPTWTPSR